MQEHFHAHTFLGFLSPAPPPVVLYIRIAHIPISQLIYLHKMFRDESQCDGHFKDSLQDFELYYL